MQTHRTIETEEEESVAKDDDSSSDDDESSGSKSRERSLEEIIDTYAG